MAELTQDERDSLFKAAWAKFAVMPSSNPGDIVWALLPAVERIVAAREAEVLERLSSDEVAEAAALGMWLGRGEFGPLPDEPTFIGRYWRRDARAALAAARAALTDPARQLAADPKDGENDG